MFHIDIRQKPDVKVVPFVPKGDMLCFRMNQKHLMSDVEEHLADVPLNHSLGTTGHSSITDHEGPFLVTCQPSLPCHSVAVTLGLWAPWYDFLGADVPCLLPLLGFWPTH